MAVKVKLRVPMEIRVALIQAISNYLDYRHVKVLALEEMITENKLAKNQMASARAAIHTLKTISSVRKNDLCQLLDIIYEHHTTVGDLFTMLLTYLSTLQTGWWIFTTGQSKLKTEIMQVIQRYNATEWDNRAIQAVNAGLAFRSVADPRRAGRLSQRLESYESFGQEITNVPLAQDALSMNSDDLDVLSSYLADSSDTSGPSSYAQTAPPHVLHTQARVAMSC